MYKSCHYCGKIVDTKHQCLMKPKRVRAYDDKDENIHIIKFRNSQSWQRKRKEIRDRDHNLCQVCIRELYHTITKYTYDGISVHHIVSLMQDFSLRLHDMNLLTLCKQHHDYADQGIIPAIVLREIAQEQNEKWMQ